MMESKYAQTSVIGFGRTVLFLSLGVVILPVFALYSLGYLLKRNGWGDGWRRWIMTPLTTAFAIINTLHNWTVCTVLFAELPREFMTTARLKRLKNSPDVSKRELADLMGGFLDSQDPGHY